MSESEHRSTQKSDRLEQFKDKYTLCVVDTLDAE